MGKRLSSGSPLVTFYYDGLGGKNGVDLEFSQPHVEGCGSQPRLAVGS